MSSVSDQRLFAYYQRLCKTRRSSLELVERSGSHFNHLVAVVAMHMDVPMAQVRETIIKEYAALHDIPVEASRGRFESLLEARVEANA